MKGANYEFTNKYEIYLDFLREIGAESSAFGREGCFSEAFCWGGGGGACGVFDFDFDADPLLDELPDPELPELDALEDRDDDPELDDERDRLPDELALPLVPKHTQSTIRFRS